MKTISIFIIAMLASTLTFGQVKYQPKVIVVVLGPHNPTLNEANFPDLNFYYTPDLVLKKGRASKNVNKNAWSSALGIGRAAAHESNDSYTGSPEAIVENGLHSGTAYLFDKNGISNAETFSGEREYFTNKTIFMTKFNKLKRKWDGESMGDLLKLLVKKGESVKQPKKLTAHVLGREIYNFQVSDINGKQHDIQDLVKGNPATLALFLYINPEYDLKEAMNSGKGKKGRTYMNQAAQFMAAQRQINPLYNLEQGIFGKRLNR